MSESFACFCSLSLAAQPASGQPGALVHRGLGLFSPVQCLQTNSLRQTLAQVSKIFSGSVIYRMTCDAAVVCHGVWRHLSSFALCSKHVAGAFCSCVYWINDGTMSTDRCIVLIQPGSLTYSEGIDPQCDRFFLLHCDSCTTKLPVCFVLSMLGM